MQINTCGQGQSSGLRGPMGASHARVKAHFHPLRAWAKAGSPLHLSSLFVAGLAVHTRGLLGTGQVLFHEAIA